MSWILKVCIKIFCWISENFISSWVALMWSDFRFHSYHILSGISLISTRDLSQVLFEFMNTTIALSVGWYFGAHFYTKKTFFLHNFIGVTTKINCVLRGTSSGAYTKHIFTNGLHILDSHCVWGSNLLLNEMINATCLIFKATHNYYSC